jgi:hypothetical protein
MISPKIFRLSRLPELSQPHPQDWVKLGELHPQYLGSQKYSTESEMAWLYNSTSLWNADVWLLY